MSDCTLSHCARADGPRTQSTTAVTAETTKAVTRMDTPNQTNSRRCIRARLRHRARSGQRLRWWAGWQGGTTGYCSRLST